MACNLLPTAGERRSDAADHIEPTAARSGGRVIIGAAADATVLNPVLSTDVFSSQVWSRIYESLIKVDNKTGQPLPRLAERFEVSPDSTRLTFTLRNGLIWSDGSAFTGEDFKFTAEAVMRSDASQRKNVFKDIAGAQQFAENQAESISGISVDGNTITVRLNQPFCPAITAIGEFGIIPKHVFEKFLSPYSDERNVDKAEVNSNPIVAMGPFRLKEWKPKEHIILVRNERYFGIPSHLDELVFKVMPNSTTRAGALKTGEIDVALVEPQDVAGIREQPSLSFYSYLAPGYIYIGWNQLRGGKEFFQSKSVRQALAYGLNIDEFIQTALDGEGRRMLAHTPPVSWAYDASGLQEYKFDPERARNLLEQDGWTLDPSGVYQKGGQRLEFELAVSSESQITGTLAEFAVEQYRRIGVSATRRTEPFQALTERLRKQDARYGTQGGRDVDAFILGLSLGVDPDAFSNWHSSQAIGGFNRVGYKNELVDRALEDGRSACMQSQRAAAYRAFDRQLNEDQPFNFGFARNTLLFVNNRVEGVDPGPYPNETNGYLWNVERWRLRT
jgi:peptide/nickel transport system substrate-binding protein